MFHLIDIFHNTPKTVEHGGYKTYQQRLCTAQNGIFKKKIDMAWIGTQRVIKVII